MFRVLTVLLFIACSFSPAKAGPDSTRFVHFDISNGFPSNNVYSLVTDANGYIWFATDKGIVKYNGYTFAIFNTGNGLPSDDVWELVPDNEGRVWVYSFGYQFGYMKNGRYNLLNYKPSNRRILYAHYLSEVGDVVYLMIGDDYVADMVIISGGIVKSFPFGKSVGIHKKLGIIDSYLGNGFAYYVLDSNENVYKWDIVKGSNKYEHTFKADEALRYGYRYRRAISPDMEQYSFRFNGKTIHRHRFLERIIDTPISLAMMGANEDENIYVFNPYFLKGNRNKNSVVITNSHMYSINKSFKFVNRVAIRDIVPTKAQLAYYYIDTIGNEWFTTKDDGVWLSPKRSTLLSSIKLSELLGNCVFTGAVGSKSYWWNRHDLTLYIIDKNELSARIRFPAGSSIRTVTGGNGELFIGGESGIYQYSGKDRSLIPLEDKYRTRLKLLDKKAQYKAILQHRKSTFEFVNLIKEVKGNIYSIASDYALLHSVKEDSLVSEILYAERFSGLQASGHVLILYNNQKMVVRNDLFGSETTFVSEDLKSLGIKNIKQVEKDIFDNWYFLDDEKLFVCNARSRNFKQLNLNVNLRESHLKIAGNELILAGKFGIGYAQIKGPCAVGNLHVIPNFMATKSYYNQVKSLSVTDDGYIILQTDKGIFDFTLQQLRSAKGVSSSGGEVLKLMLKAPYEEPIAGCDTFAVKQEDKKITLDVVNYFGKGTVTYFYKTVPGIQWEESGSGEIFISNLTPGRYHKILCKAKDDLWESRVYTIYIYRYPMWWQTDTWRTIFWIAGVVFFLTLVLLTIFITRYFVAKKNERRRALTDLELQAIHSQINPHFIFNTLSAALFYINKRRFDDAYTHVNKFSQLLRSYLKSSHDRYVILDEEIKMLKNYIELQQIRFEEKFEYRIEVDNKLPINNIRIPSLLLQPLVENAINHGLFHRENGGILLLKFEQGADHTELVCTIEDNGVGREAAKKINESTSAKESYGTTLTNQLLDVFKQYEKLDIKMSYADKDLPETGTVVTLTLKNIKYVA